MGDQIRRRPVAIFCRSWGDPSDESASVLRSLSGAISRLAAVPVFVPGAPTTSPVPDGAFDLRHVGGTSARPGSPAAWPSVDAIHRSSIPDLAEPPGCVLVDATDDAGRDVARTLFPGIPLVALAAQPSIPSGYDSVVVVGAPSGRESNSPTDGLRGRVAQVGTHVAVNQLAAASRHNGLGETGYVLVLAGEADPEPPPAVAWLTARFARATIVAVQRAVASVWRGRALRGSIPVDTRTDLWRLMAAALLTVDLAPGSLIARECVESLLFGVPVVVPAGGSGAQLVDASGGGRLFGDEGGLCNAVASLRADGASSAVGGRGRSFAEREYADPARFESAVTQAAEVLGFG